MFTSIISDNKAGCSCLPETRPIYFVSENESFLPLTQCWFMFKKVITD